MVNRICNAMTVKFVGRPTTTLLACDTWDYAQVIDFEHYKIDPKYRAEINNNVDENRFDITNPKMPGAGQSLNNYEEVVLYGHSTGGLISILYQQNNSKEE